MNCLAATVIYFGIRNYYKHNSVFRLAECEACGERNQLHSYNALRCAHVYWIPLIPVGRTRVLRYCPACKHHGEMSTAAWKERRERELLPLLQTARGVGSKHIDVEKLLRLLSEVGTRDEFLSVAQRLRTDATSQTTWLGLLADTYASFGERVAALDVLSVLDNTAEQSGEGEWISGCDRFSTGCGREDRVCTDLRACKGAGRTSCLPSPGANPELRQTIPGIHAGPDSGYIVEVVMDRVRDARDRTFVLRGPQQQSLVALFNNHRSWQ